MQWKATLLGIVVGALGAAGSVQFLDPPSARAAQPHALSDKEIVDRCYLLFSAAPHAVFDNRFLGVEALQNPLDVWVTQEIIHETRPDFIVDVGTYKGGSAALWAVILEEVNPEGRVISIDIEDRVTDANELPVVQRRVEFLVGSSVDPKIVAAVAERVRGKRVLVILDSLHTRDHVAKELEAYSPLVGVGGYVIVQDTPLDRYTRTGLRAEGYSDAMIRAFDVWISTRSFYAFFRSMMDEGPGAGAGVAKFLAGNDRFVVDKYRERFLLTNNWNGYLKRIR